MVHLDNPQIPMSYFMKPTEHLSPPNSMAKDFANLQGWVWVRTGSHFDRPNDLEQFVRTVMPNITRPIRLISGDGDSGVPGNLVPGVADAILEHPMVNVWYTQNYDGSMSHPKIKTIADWTRLAFRLQYSSRKAFGSRCSWLLRNPQFLLSAKRQYSWVRSETPIPNVQ